MINFKVKILKYTKDTKSFWVEYIPEESMTPPCYPVRQTFILNSLSTETTPDEIYKFLSDMAPHQHWQQQIDASIIPSDKFEALAGEEREFTIDTTPEIPQDPAAEITITPEMVTAFKEVEIEAAVQRILFRLAGERV